LSSLEGLSVDEAFTLFDDGFGVKKSKQMRREKIEMQKNYNAEGVHWIETEVTEKDKAFHVESVTPTQSIE
jgi:MFS transporter, SP family, solute carrier family 2 (myo-inositol transporter), member 13